MSDRIDSGEATMVLDAWRRASAVGMIGFNYRFGAGNSGQKLADLEFHRHRHMADLDSRQVLGTCVR